MSLDEILNEPKSNARGCPICGEPNAAAISVRITRLGEHGRIATEKGSAKQRGVSLCERHASEFWQTLSILVSSRRAGDD